MARDSRASSNATATYAIDHDHDEYERHDDAYRTRSRSIRFQDSDLEKQKSRTPTIRKPTLQPHFNAPHWRIVASQAYITQEVLDHNYIGSGTEEDPYLVDYLSNDPRNPMKFSEFKKWMITVIVAIATLAVAFVSSAYSGGLNQVIVDFHTSEEVVILGISLFVLGFAIGPLIWAPLSELYGRQKLFIITYAGMTAFNAGAAGSQNIQTLVILRFFAGAIGSSPLTNAGGTLADMFNAKQRGIAIAIFAAAPFLGPTIGPIVGGFVGETVGFRWVEGVMAIFTGVVWLVGWATVPETYTPVILRRRADELSRLTGRVYISKLDRSGRPKLGAALKKALGRPWILLVREPIVALLSLYMAIIYGTLYMLFAAFPIVYQEYRGWSEGIGGLAFLGVAVGMIIAVAFAIYDNKRYSNTVDEAVRNGAISAPPEARLPPAMIGSIAIPVGMFWFAWTNSPSIPWIVSILAGAPFGFGLVLVFLSIMNYLIDAYVIYAASVLAANSVLRSLFGAVFPLFTTYMFDNLGIHWASSIPAFLALMCVPFPFLFYKFGAKIRRSCKFAREAEDALIRMKSKTGPSQPGQGQNQEDESDERGRAGEDDESEIADEEEIERGRAAGNHVEKEKDVEKGEL